MKSLVLIIFTLPTLCFANTKTCVDLLSELNKTNRKIEYSYDVKHEVLIASRNGRLNIYTQHGHANSQNNSNLSCDSRNEWKVENALANAVENSDIGEMFLSYTNPGYQPARNLVNQFVAACKQSHFPKVKEAIRIFEARANDIHNRKVEIESGQPANP